MAERPRRPGNHSVCDYLTHLSQVLLVTYVSRSLHGTIGPKLGLTASLAGISDVDASSTEPGAVPRLELKDPWNARHAATNHMMNAPTRHVSRNRRNQWTAFRR